MPPAVAAITGLAALLHASATAFHVLRYAGVAYLLVTLVVFAAYGLFAASVRRQSCRVRRC